jgi:hypothetical protein
MQIMVKALEEVIKKAEHWPREDQEELAEYAREIEARRTRSYVMSDAERAAVREGLAEADRGEFIFEEEVAKADKRRGL